ncbi:sigma-70 family RNA polymerase sigma factor [Streptococcus dysgalactiae subsp. dysgalactiae]|nr:sigma-70 family RNA polymerase sigma factor [Streptococcus dysgalactiae subsp. dysgalactiae]QGG98047.1 sigma-70 family RNA polymerase sigma factor [Streptococcus dysgalactiae subsp. dysgalactiae]
MVVKDKLKRLKISSEMLNIQMATLKQVKSIASNMSDSSLLHEVEEQIAKEVSELTQERSETLKKVNSLMSADQVTVIKLRYMNGYSWDRIAYIMRRSLNTVYRLHKKALEQLEE